MEKEPKAWYVINFYDSDEFAIAYTIYEKAENMADDFGEVYELFGFESYLEAEQQIVHIRQKFN